VCILLFLITSTYYVRYVTKCRVYANHMCIGIYRRIYCNKRRNDDYDNWKQQNYSKTWTPAFWQSTKRVCLTFYLRVGWGHSTKPRSGWGVDNLRKQHFQSFGIQDWKARLWLSVLPTLLFHFLFRLERPEIETMDNSWGSHWVEGSILQSD
jgi:hypothetical protein